VIRLSFKPAIAIAIAAASIPEPLYARKHVCCGTVPVVAGEELIKVYGKGEGAVKAFCINCGSSCSAVIGRTVRKCPIRMGAFDDDPGIRPQFHTFVDDRAPWDTITTIFRNILKRRT